MTLRRAKLGILVPSVNTTLEPELGRMAPENVTLHFSRLKLKADIREDLERMSETMDDEVHKLSDARVDAIAFGCTAGSLIGGEGYDEQIIKRIVHLTGIQATTTSTAVVDALDEMKIRNISLATPYTRWLNSEVVKFLESRGFNVVSTECLGLEIGMADVSGKRVFELVKSVDRPKSDGVFISCTDLPTIGVINNLEKDLKKPVISSNHATLWKMLRMVKIQDDAMARWGSLFRKL